MKNIKWTYSPQKGIPGHCFQAQVWNEKGESIAVIEATRNSKDATAIAKLMSEAPETKKQYEKMHEAIDLFINGKKSLYDQVNAIKKMESLLKKID